MHLYVEHLLDAILRMKSPIRKATDNFKDHRTYSFAVKLALVAHLGILPDGLFENLQRLNSLRNEYAHGIDVNLADEFDSKERHFIRRDRNPLFDDVAGVRAAIEGDPDNAGLGVLESIREVTLDWLWEVCDASGIPT